MEISGIHVVIGLVVVAYYVVTIWAIIVTLRDSTVLPMMTALWVAALLLFPGFGLLAWIVWRFVRKSSGLPGFAHMLDRK